MGFHNMCSLKLLSYIIILFYTEVKCEAPNTIRLPLYKQTAYTTAKQFIENVEEYTKILPFYFGRKSSNFAVGKLDKNVDYCALVELGLPKHQKFTVNMDTSYSGFWIPSSFCYLSFFCYGKNYYTKSQSVLYIRDVIDGEQQEQKIVYRMDSSSVVGTTGFDTLWVEEIEVPLMHFMEATEISYDAFHGIAADGIFGLGFYTEGLMMAPPIFTMIDRGRLDSPEFSLYVGKTSVSGEIVFGGRNTRLYQTDTLQFHKLVSAINWEVHVETILFNKRNHCISVCIAMIDTGTALIAAPLDSLQYIYRTLNLTYTGQVAEVNCSQVWSMPLLTIGFNGQKFSLSGYDYTIQVENTCVLGFMESPIKKFWILGNTFLAKVYTVFDIGERRIGFAELNSRNK